MDRLRVTGAVRGGAQLITPFFKSSVQDLTRCVIKDFCNERKHREEETLLHLMYITRHLNNMAYTANEISTKSRAIMYWHKSKSEITKSHSKLTVFPSQLAYPQFPPRLRLSVWESFSLAHHHFNPKSKVLLCLHTPSM